MHQFVQNIFFSNSGVDDITQQVEDLKIDNAHNHETSKISIICMLIQIFWRIAMQ